jgi:Zn-dependent protease with chaperone function
MFLPFLPIILAALALSLIHEEAWGPISIWWGGPLGVSLAGLTALAIWMGQSSLPQGWSKARRKRLQRALIFGAWLGVVHVEALTFRLEAFLGAEARELSLGVGLLLLHFWLLDALSYTVWQSSLREYLQDLSRHLRLQLPILLLGGFHALWLHFIHWAFPELSPNYELLLSTLTSIVWMLILAPPAMVWGWGLKPLSAGESRLQIEAELHANKSPVREIVTWPETLFAGSTAGVIGLFPRFRYLLVSPRLLRFLSPEELRAVVAHESGHLKRRHLLFYAFSFLAFIELLIFASMLLTFSEWLGLWEMPTILYGAAALLGLLIFFRFGLGFLSRNFERQADCHSLKRLGLEPISQALLKVAWLNGIDPEKPNWHHYGIMERLNFLRLGEQHPEEVSRHHRRVRRIQWGSGLLLVLLLTVNTYSTSEAGVQGWVRLYTQHAGELRPEGSEWFTRLGDYAYGQGDLQQAEHEYRRAVELDSSDFRALNNLAWVLTERYPQDAVMLGEAVELASNALKLRSEAFIWDTLAEGYRLLGNQEKATAAAQEALHRAEAPTNLGPHSSRSYYEDRLAQIRNASF